MVDVTARRYPTLQFLYSHHIHPEYITPAVQNFVADAFGPPASRNGGGGYARDGVGAQACVERFLAQAADRARASAAENAR